MRTLCSAWSTSRVHWKSYHLFQNYGRLCLLDLPFCVPSIHSSNLAIISKYWSKLNYRTLGHYYTKCVSQNIWDKEWTDFAVCILKIITRKVQEISNVILVENTSLDQKMSYGMSKISFKKNPPIYWFLLIPANLLL